MIARLVGLAGLVLIFNAALAPSAEEPWIELSGEPGLEAWNKPHGDWLVAGGVEVDPNKPRRLLAKPGKGVLVNGPKGSTHNLLSKKSFGDMELHLEFLIPTESNSGVKFEGLY